MVALLQQMRWVGVVGVAGATLYASDRYDPALHDWRGPASLRGGELKELGELPEPNAHYLKNDGQMIPTFDDEHPAPETVAVYEAYWTLDMYGPRRLALIVEDMEVDYEPWVDYVTPNAARVLEAFRNASFPVVWTNWDRKPFDGHYGALDRFYGPSGLPKGENTMYIYDVDGKDGTATLPVLAPRTQAEKSLVLKSFHLSKFADLDDAGDEILDPLLRAWRINTLIIVGAWTDDCVAATVTEAVDRYGYDVVVISDAVASGTASHRAAIEVMKGSLAKTVTTQEFLDYIGSATNLAGPPDGVPIDASVPRDRRPRGKKDVDDAGLADAGPPSYAFANKRLILLSSICVAVLCLLLLRACLCSDGVIRKSALPSFSSYQAVGSASIDDAGAVQLVTAAQHSHQEGSSSREGPFL